MKLFIKFFLFISLVFSFFVFKAEADSTVSIKVESGINGVAKRDKAFPVEVTVKNSGEAFSGQLVVTVSPDHQSTGNLVFPVELAGNTEKTIQFSVPGNRIDSYNARNNQTDFNQVRLYEGDWSSGNVVASERYLKPRWMPTERFVIGVLSNQPDSLSFLKLIDFMTDSDVMFIESNDIPNQSEGLESLDVLVTHQISLNQLEKEQQRAIEEWLYNGGHILASSEPGLSNKYGSLGHYLPLQVNDRLAISNPEIFSKVVKHNFETETPFNVFTGELKPEATVVYEEKGIPFVVQQSYGLGGSVIQTSYSIADPALVDWDGYSKWWRQLVNGLSQNMSNIKYSPYNYNGVQYAVGENSNWFPSFSGEKLPIIYLFLGFYVIVLIPIQYVLLKRKDKREWAWVIIPLFAIVSSAAIFSFGAFDRLTLTVNETSVIALDGKGKGTGYTGFSLLSNGAGDYEVDLLHKEEYLNPERPFPMSTRYINNPEDLMDYAYVSKDVKKEQVLFRDVEFWSIRTGKLKLPLQETGQIDGDLMFKDGVVSGMLTNQLSFSLSEVYLLAGTEFYELGGINQGEQLAVNLEVNEKINGFFNSPANSIPAQMYPNAHHYQNNKIDFDERKKHQLIEQVVRQNFYIQEGDGPVLIGLSNDSLVPMEVNGKTPRKNSLNVITQAVTVDIQSTDRIPVKKETLIPELKVIEGNLHFNGLLENERFVDVSPGTFDLIYSLPTIFKKQDSELTKVIVTFSRLRNDTTFRLYNYQTSDYEDFNGNNRVYTFENELSNYINPSGQFTIQFEHAVNGRVDIPQVSIEGMLNK